MPRFEYKNEQSNKFWDIKRSGNKLTVSFGKIGTPGQSKDKLFDSPDEAKSEYEKLIAEKVRKGYLKADAVSRARSAKPEKLDARKQAKSPAQKLAKDRETFSKGMRSFLSSVGVSPDSYGDDCPLFAIADPEAGSNFESSPGKSAQMVKVLGSQFSPLLTFSIEIPKGYRISCDSDKTSALLQVYAVDKRGALKNTLLVVSAGIRKETMKAAALRKYVCSRWRIESVPNDPATPFESATLKDGQVVSQIRILRAARVPFNSTRVKKVALGGMEFYQCSSIQKKKTLTGSDWCELIGQDDTRLLSLRISASQGHRDNLELGTKVLLSFCTTG